MLRCAADLSRFFYQLPQRTGSAPASLRYCATAQRTVKPPPSGQRDAARPPTAPQHTPDEPPATFRAAEADDGTRLDRFIKRKAPGLPPGLIQRLIRKRRILVNDVPAVRNAHPVHSEDLVRIPGSIKLGLSRGKRAPPENDVSLAEAEQVRRWELHRDARCVVLNKPPGLPTQGGTAVGERHLERLLPGLGAGRYWLVHRLDREVSGALVVARDVGAAGLLAEHFRERRVVKRYWALVAGAPDASEGVVDAPVDGKRAITAWRVVYPIEKRFAWLELEPRTGRKHQLRVHCAYELKTPIVGDMRYGWDGGDEGGLGCLEGPGLHLFARSIEFPKLTREMSGGGKRARRKSPEQNVTVTAPLPPHMKDSWRRFGLQEKFAE